MFEEYLLRRLKKQFQELFTENYGGVFYNNNLVESCIGFAACSRNALVRRQHYWGYWQLLGNFRICLRHAVLLRYILEMHLYIERDLDIWILGNFSYLGKYSTAKLPRYSRLLHQSFSGSLCQECSMESIGQTPAILYGCFLKSLGMFDTMKII